MTYLLDTNHCSYIQQKRPEVIKRLQGLPPDSEIITSVVTQGELLAGIALIKDDIRKNKLKQIYEEIMAILADILGIDSRVAQEYAEIFADLRKNGTPIPTNDLWIAAIAKAHNATLVTNDHHFKHINGLQCEDWTQAPAAENASVPSPNIFS